MAWYKNKLAVSLTAAVIVAGGGIGAYYLLQDKEAENPPIVKEEVSQEEKNLINNLSQGNVAYELLLDEYRTFTLEEIAKNLDNNRDTKYVDYIKDEKNKKFYMEHVYNFEDEFKVMLDPEGTFKEVQEIIKKDLEDITLEEKLKLDTYYSRQLTGAIDVFNFNLFKFKTDDIVNKFAELPEEDREKLKEHKNDKYLSSESSLTEEQKELLLYQLVVDYYFDYFNNEYSPLPAVQVSDLESNKEQITIQKLAHLMFNNYYKLLDTFEQTAIYKSTHASNFVSQEVMDQVLALNLDGLEQEYNRIIQSGEEVTLGSYESYVVSEYTAYKTFNASPEDIEKEYEELSKKPLNEMTLEEEYKLMAVRDYMSHKDEPEVIEEHLLEFKVRYDDNFVLPEEETTSVEEGAEELVDEAQ